MSEVIDDPALSRMLAAYNDNRLLRTFPDDLKNEPGERMEIVSLEVGVPVFGRGDQVTHSLFPLGATMVSLIVELIDGRTVEVASIGNEGAVGGIVSCGNIPAFSRAETIAAGHAIRVPIDIVEAAKCRSGHLRNLFCRYADFLLAQTMQSVACNSFHQIDARAARWLLAAVDRSGDRLELTQEAFAKLLGVQRTTINAVVRQLQEDGLIETQRGVVQVTDREGLCRVSCECYDRIERFFGDIIGTAGAGGVERNLSVAI